MNFEDRRKSRRADISFPVECDMIPDKSYFCTVSKDLSGSGARIIVEDFIPKGNIIKIHLNIIDRVVEIKAKVAWCNKERVSDRYSAGVEFLEVSKTHNNALSKLLSTIQ